MSFRLKLIISISLLIALAFGIGGAVLVSTAFQTSLHEEKAASMRSYQMMRNTLYLLNSLGEKTDYDHMADALKQMEQQGTVRWQAIHLESYDRSVFQSGDQNLLLADLPHPDSDQVLLRCDFG